MTFKKLAEYFERLEKTTSRLEMTRILAELFKKASAEEIDKICYLALGRLVPLYERLEFNLAEKMVIRAIANAFRVNQKNIISEFKQVGDLGVVARVLKLKTQSSKLKALTVLEVYKRLRAIAEDKGQGSQERKVKGAAELLKDLDALSVRYVTRVVVGKLRLGFSDKTMIDGLSWMKKGDKSLRDELEKAYFVRADIGELARQVKSEKLKVKSVLRKIKPSLGIPVMPALCQRLKSADEMVSKMGKVIAEPKWDGVRCQIHIKKSQKWRVKTFTRNLDETTHMFPELKQAYKQLRAREVILDSEGVGIDPQTKRLLTFQQTIVRKRKHEVEEISQKVPLRFYVFDILYQDGKSLIKEPLRKRKQILAKILKGSGSPSRKASEGQGVLRLTDYIVTNDPKELRKYHKRQLAKKLEGAVVKRINDPYVPGRRGWSWVKFKEEEEAAGGLADTLDCVVMGYYRGKGKRASFGIGAFLVGVRKREKILTIAKIGTGLSDEQWKDMKARSTKQEARKMPKEYKVHKSLIPDAWVEPKIVVEIAADNITKSPVHSAKLALRFPRLVKIRDDKRASQATSLRELRQLAL